MELVSTTAADRDKKLKILILKGRAKNMTMCFKGNQRTQEISTKQPVQSTSSYWSSSRQKIKKIKVSVESCAFAFKGQQKSQEIAIKQS